MKPSPELYEEARREMKRLDRMVTDWINCPNCESDEGPRMEFIEDGDTLLEVYCEACGKLAPNGRAVTSQVVTWSVPPPTAEAEKLWIAAIVKICSPSNAEWSPKTASFMETLRPDLRESVESVFDRRAEFLATAGMGLVKTIQKFGRQGTDDLAMGVSKFLCELGDPYFHEAPLSGLLETLGAGGDSWLVDAFWNVDTPLGVYLQECIRTGSRVDDYLPQLPEEAASAVA